MAETETPVDFPPTKKTRIKRKNFRAHYDRATVHAILDAGLMCSVGYVIDGQPYVTPTAYWRVGDHVYWHGSSASRMLRTLKDGVAACLTVAHLDGIVFARSGFHHSLRYRSVMMFGTAFEVPAERKEKTLEDFMERLAPGRWAELRRPTAQELKGTSVFFMEIDEVAAKVREGGCLDAESDMDAKVWAGVLPLGTRILPPEPDARILPGIPEPAYLKTLRLG